MLRHIFLLVSNLPFGCNIEVARFEALMAVLPNIQIFWNATPHRLSSGSSRSPKNVSLGEWWLTQWHILRDNKSSTTLFWECRIPFPTEMTGICSVHELMTFQVTHYTPSYQLMPVTSEAMQWLVQSVTSLSLCRPRFNTRPVYVGFVVDKVGRVFHSKSDGFPIYMNLSMRPTDALPANRSWQPSRSHGTYQHEAITSRSRQLLMMGTRLPETCWAIVRREIKNTKSDI